MHNASGELNLNGVFLLSRRRPPRSTLFPYRRSSDLFTSNSSSFTNFAASGAFLTVLNGTAAQTGTVSFPGEINKRMQNLWLTHMAGVVFSSNIQINGNFDVTVAAGVSGTGTMTLAGN